MADKKITNRGRGVDTNPDSRFLKFQRQGVDDGWSDQSHNEVQTQIFIDKSRTIISRNQSPDVPFEQSINPYKGCEHGCCYCFARPGHSYLDLSPGLDFESKIFYKPSAASLLEAELSKANYRVSPIALGANTDAYQPVERKLGISRKIVKVLKAYQHPFVVITKSALIERDLDLLIPMAQSGLVKVIVSVTTMDPVLSRRLEPRAASPKRRIQLIEALVQEGIPVGALFAPLIPVLNEPELEHILQAVAQAGVESAAYVMLRLPHELQQLFPQWLEQYYPEKAQHVLNIIRDIRSGEIYNSNWGERMTGTGQYAQLIRQRFHLACKKNGLNIRQSVLNSNLFSVPIKSGDQLSLFS